MSVRIISNSVKCARNNLIWVVEVHLCVCISIEKIMYTKEEKIAWLKKYYVGWSYWGIFEDFVEAFPNRPKPSHTTIMRLISRFEATGTADYLWTGNHANREAPVSNYAVLTVVEGNPYVSCLAIAREVGIFFSQVNRRWYKYGYTNYKMCASQKLEVGDPKIRYMYAMAVAEKMIENPNLLCNVLFTDEIPSTILLISRTIISGRRPIRALYTGADRSMQGK